ncbi:ABC transporter substrate-binding protein, partial [Candidatus Bipolaricaulota bacterium]|nr:ABC transporter substrate-binding protein [Candidatus Bipolaricaulota bacterium]
MKTTGRRFWLSCFLVGALLATMGIASWAQGTFRAAMQPIVRIDPATISSDAEVAVANAVYDYLVDIGADNKIQPRLAVSWDVSADGLTYVFQLPDGIHFHDGTPLVPGDVVWTFDRLRDPANGFATSSLYANIEQITASGPNEVTFRLATPNPFFLYDLSDNHALILKRGTTDFTAFNGTGPFVVESYQAEDRIVMRANDDYFVAGMPRLDRLEFIFFSDQVAAVNALRGGQVDMAWRMPMALYLGLQNEAGIVTTDVMTNGFDLVRLRADQPPGDDPRVRQALKMATDREAIFQFVQLGVGSIGNDTPFGPLYAETGYYDRSLASPAYDPVAARALLEDAGYPTGFEIDLYTPDTGGRPDLAVALKEMWKNIGVVVNVIIEPESIYYGENHWIEENLGITGWSSRPYPQFYLVMMLTCDAPWNEPHFCDEQFDDWVALAGSTLDEQERLATYSLIQR